MKEMKNNIQETFIPPSGGFILDFAKLLFPLVMLGYSVKMSYDNV